MSKHVSLVTEPCGDVVRLLKSGKSVVTGTSGRSMEPLLHEGETQVLIRPLTETPQPGDILLWWRWDDVLILHRLIGEDEERFLLRGDNCAKSNRARKDRIVGVVTDICRNGRWFSVKSRRYRAYVRFWMSTAPMRLTLHRAGAKARDTFTRNDG